MNKNFVSIFKNFIKGNRFKLIGLSLIAIVFSLLIIEAIHLLTLPDDNSNKGSKNRDNTSASDNRSSNGRDTEEEGRNEKKTPFDKGSFPGDSSNGEWADSGDRIDPNLEQSLKDSMPNIEIDLSGWRSLQPGFGSGNSYSIKIGEKPEHVPIMEVAGIVGTQFFKLSTMDTYGNNKWKISDDAYHVAYKKPPILNMNSVKVKPFKPAKGFIPVACNSTGVRFPTPFIINFPNLNMYYTDREFSDYYEMYCKIPVPGEQGLRSASIENAEGFSISGADDIYALARKITEGISKPYDKVKAIENYLKNNYELEQGEGYTDPDDDALNDFLFYSKKGSQLDFVSSFVWLLWCSDISARIGVGYKVDPDTNYQIVYADQLCVFPEINFEEYGWIPYEAFVHQAYIPPTQTSIEITKIDTVVKKGMTFSVEGTVKDESGAKVSGIPVMIYLKKDKNEGCLAYARGEVQEGAFKIECILDGKTDVGKYNVVAHAVENDKYRGSWSDPEIRVTADTKITLDVPKTVLSRRNFMIKGYIFEELTDIPVKEGIIEYSFENSATVQKQIKGKVKEDGNFTETLMLDIKEGVKPDRSYIFAYGYRTKFQAKFLESDLYLSSKKVVEMNILVILWYRILLVIVIIIILVVLGVALYKLLNKRKREFSEETVRIAFATGNTYIEDKVYTDNHQKTQAELMEIVFPQISPEMPNVWGLGETLLIRFIDRFGNFDEISVSFDSKGSKRITLFSENRNVTKKQYIRIVAYREEIIDLGKELFTRLHKKFHNVDFKRMTPREIIEGIPKDMRISVKSDFEKIILIFEKATYSFNPIARKDYEGYFKSLAVVENWLNEVGS